MTVLSFPRRSTKRQEVMKQRRAFSMPSAWIFSCDRQFYYLKFDQRRARKIRRKLNPLGKPAIVNYGEEILRRW